MSQPKKYTESDWPDWAQPLPLVHSIFAKMLVRYGPLWTSRTDGPDIMLLLRDWGMGLAGFRKESIVWALENLPDDAPPLLGQFKAIVARAPEPKQQVLEAPKPDPVRVAAELQRMRDAQRQRDRLQWALDLQERDARGDRLTEAQRRAYKEALEVGDGNDDVVQLGFTPVREEALPPAMRRARGERREWA